jgi:two-component system sensor histidine kinase/response regulator
MTGQTGKAKGNIWKKLTGEPGEFTMENRAFNYASVITFLLLLYYLAFEFFFSPGIMSVVITVLLLVQCVLYYFSRFKKRYHTSIMIYAILSYATLVLNYYNDAGISGTTLCLFFVTFHLLIAIGKPSQYLLWIALHTGIFCTLLATEYMHPEWVANYDKRSELFVDKATTMWRRSSLFSPLPIF